MKADRLKRCLVCMGGLLLGLSRPVEAHSGAVAAVAVNGGGIGRVAELIFPRQAFGATVEASRGRRVKAGGGFRQGSWQTLGVVDGLPSAAVSAIAQDRGGDLWFGTRSGVGRYDGEWITSYTVREGLGGNNVWSIVEDQQGNMWFGTNGGVSRYDGKSFTTFTTQEGLAGNYVFSVLEDRQGSLWFGTEGGVSRYDGKGFTTFAAQDGLAGNYVFSMLEDRQGNLWFGTIGGGVSRYDGKGFTTITAKDGLARNEVTCILEDQQGDLWFGTFGGGVSRYDGKGFTTFLPSGDEMWAMLEDRQGNLWVGTSGGVCRYDSPTFRTFTAQDGLVSYTGTPLLEDRQGNLWFGSRRSDLSRYDGKGFTTFTTQDGLAGNGVGCMLEDRQGNLWFGTWGGVSRYDGKRFATLTDKYPLAGAGYNTGAIVEDQQGNLWLGTWGSGVSRYDGKGFTTFTVKDGLAADEVRCMLEDRQGNLWFGTDSGASQYDGKRFTTFTVKDGLAADEVRCMLEDHQGNLWFGTFGGGVSRYDGRGFTTFTTHEGLADNMVLSILEDHQGHLWFGTWAGGVSQYDGTVFQSLLRQDGLVDNGGIVGMLQARDGDFWFASDSGVTRYRPHPAPPLIRLIDVVADRRYGPVTEIRLPSTQQLVAFEFQGISFKTRPGQMVYLYRLAGYDADWRQTRENKVEYTDLPLGRYTFQVKAVDRDLDYSEEPAEVLVTIHPPYDRIALVGGLGLALLGLIITSGYAVRQQRRRTRSERALMQEMAEELQTAHEMQMGLMPKESPWIAGLEIAGRCQPANHVGGDFFQYFHAGGRLSICLADVTGHAMEAAIPVVMFSGILENQMESGQSLEELFGKLNRSLHRILERRTFICFAMGELDLVQRILRLSNSGCPYPYHFRATTDEVVELRVDAYPLGIRPDITYPVIEVQLEPRDRVVFCSDGIIEAENGQGELFGFERTAELIRQGCQEGLSAEALLERLMGEVRTFRGEVPQGDDQTVVVLKVES